MNDEQVNNQPQNASQLEKTEENTASTKSNASYQGPDSIKHSSCIVTDTDNSIILHAIIPVKIFQKGKCKMVTTYAFYDNWSSGCFLTEQLLQELDADGTQTTLQLKTMHGVSRQMSTSVTDLIVSDLHGNNQIELPRCLSQPEKSSEPAADS